MFRNSKCIIGDWWQKSVKNFTIYRKKDFFREKEGNKIEDKQKVETFIKNLVESNKLRHLYTCIYHNK